VKSLALAFAAALLLIGAAQAANLVSDPTFESCLTTSGTTCTSSTAAALSDPGVGGYFNTNILADWTTPSTTENTSFLYISGHENGNISQSGGSCSTPGSTGNCFALWNSTNGGTTSILTGAPTGNIIVADDSTTYNTSFYTTVSVVSGKTYQLSFFQAAGQQNGYGSAGNSITAQWQVALGSSAAQDSPLMTVLYQHFSGWQEETMTFTATTTGTVDLTFIAEGGPNGVPPFALLGDVSLVQTPEPVSLGILGLGLLGFAVAARKRMKKRANQNFPPLPPSELD